MAWRMLPLLLVVACSDQPTLRTQPPPRRELSDAARYPWLGADARHETLASRIAPPAGYRRGSATSQSFAHWLRRLPLRDAGAEVHLHDGRSKPRQDLHHSVVAIDTGRQDLQQCADAVIRLRAEFLFAAGRHDAIRFRYTSGDPSAWVRWRMGWRDRVDRNKVTWRLKAGYDASHGNFRAYLRRLFVYAGSHSLARELAPVSRIKDVAPGDVFIRGGFPGHAMLVIDAAAHEDTGQKVFLLAQSYMPAQEIHVVRNLHDRELDPWYRPGDLVITPEWTFRASELRRW